MLLFSYHIAGESLNPEKQKTGDLPAEVYLTIDFPTTGK